jgi:hypothetical protein
MNSNHWTFLNLPGYNYYYKPTKELIYHTEYIHSVVYDKGNECSAYAISTNSCLYLVLEHELKEKIIRVKAGGIAERILLGKS